MEPHITKLLSGGLNLLASADAVPEGQCVAAQNWRTDQTGILRSRKSNSAAVASPGGYVHSLMTVKRSSVAIYTYPLVGSGTAVHSLTIAGTVYSFLEGTYAAGQLASVMAGLAAADPDCIVTASGNDKGTTPYTVTIAARAVLVPGGPTIAVTGSDGNTGTALGTTRYTGADDKLYAGATELASGFDGGPLGLASFQNRLWVSNRGAAVQSKHDGVDWWNWTPTAPTNAPTYTSRATVGTPGWADLGIGSGGLQGPITYYVTGIVPGVGEVVRSAAVVVPSPSGTPVWLPFGSVVPVGNTSASATLWSTWPGWSDNYAVTITPPDFGDAAITLWNLYRVPPYNAYGNPGGQWTTLPLQQVPYLVNAQPIAVGDTYTDYCEDKSSTGGENQTLLYCSYLALAYGLSGTYGYYATGVTALGEETNPSPPLGITLAADSVIITRPSFADPQIAMWNLYRGDQDLQPYLMNATPMALSVMTYEDTGKNNALVQYGAGGVRSVVYAYPVTGNPAAVHTLTIAATTYSVTEGTDTAALLGAVLVAAAAADPDCSVVLTSSNAGVARVTIGALLTLGSGITVSGSDGNPTTSMAYASTTAVDQSDQGIAESPGVGMAINYDPAPAALGVAGPFCQKLLAFNTPAHPNRIFWTESDRPYCFPGSNSEQDGNWVDIGEQGEGIMAVAVFATSVVVLKESTYWLMTGDPGNWGSTITRTNCEIGQVGARAFCVAGPIVFGQATEAIAAFNGIVAQKMSTQLDPIFKADGVVTVNAIPSLPANPDPVARATACIAYRNGRLYYSYPDASSSTPNNTLVFSVKRSQWFTATGMLEEGTWFTDSRAFTALYDEGQTGSLLGAYGGSVYELETGANEPNIPLIYQSRYENQGGPENLKRYSDILVEHNTGGRTFTAYAYLDDGGTVVDLGTFSSTVWTQNSFPLDITEHFNIAVRLECPLGNAVAEIRTLAAHFLPLERNARTYDSGKVPLLELSLLNALEVETEVLSGAASYTLYAGISDLPELQSGPLGTGTTQIQLPDASQARWVRLTLSGDDFRCHAARLQFQPIGATLTPRDCEVMALLPAAAEPSQRVFMNARTYDTGKVALEKASLLSTLEVELEIVSGSVNWTMYAGLTSLAGLQGGVFTGTDKTFTVQLPDGTEAWWVRLVVQGDNFRCHGARLQVQPYGCYLTGVGDIFRSGDLTLNSPRVKLLQQVRVDCDPDGTIPGSFYTDIPADMAAKEAIAGWRSRVSAVLAPISLVDTGGRSWQRTTLPYNSQGRVLRVELTALAVCRVYAIQVRVKVLGEPGGWQWLDVPVPPTEPGFRWIPLPVKGAENG